MERQNDLIPRQVTPGKADSIARSLEQRSSTFAETENMVDYPLEGATIYRRKIYHPGDRVPQSLAENLDRRKESRRSERQLEKLERASQVKIKLDENTTVSADDMPLPEGFPGLQALANQGITRIGDLKTVIGDLEALPGIGDSTASKIRNSLGLMQTDGEA